MPGSNFAAKSTPVPLRSALQVEELVNACSRDPVHVLGSFWPNSRTSFESELVKSFKDCVPAHEFEPHVSHLSRFYAGLVLDRLGEERFDWVARILSSSETHPEDFRPLSKLVDLLCVRSGARDLTQLFFKTESRPPMRSVKRLRGPDAIKNRIQYVLQDLFIIPHSLGGHVLLVDDIYNVGASARVYAEALRRYAGARKVTSVNLAATRFAGGKDGHGMLKLDTAAMQEYPLLTKVWVDAQDVFHHAADCASLQPPASCAPRFAAQRRAKPCPDCLGEATRARKWWRAWLGKK